MGVKLGGGREKKKANIIREGKAIHTICFLYSLFSFAPQTHLHVMDLFASDQSKATQSR